MRALNGLVLGTIEQIRKGLIGKQEIFVEDKITIATDGRTDTSSLIFREVALQG